MTQKTEQDGRWLAVCTFLQPHPPSHISASPPTGVRRNETIQLGYQSLGTKGQGKDGLVSTGVDRMQGKNDFLNLHLPALTQLVN